jgi:hypothetical protein
MTCGLNGVARCNAGGREGIKKINFARSVVTRAGVNIGTSLTVHRRSRRRRRG